MSDPFLIYPGVALIVAVVAITIAVWLVKRSVVLIAVGVLIIALSMLLPGPRNLATAAIAMPSMSEKMSCAKAGVASFDVLRGRVEVSSLEDCAKPAESKPAKETRPTPSTPGTGSSETRRARDRINDINNAIEGRDGS